MRNQIEWPPLRTDVIGVICIAVVVACLVLERWPALAIAALVGAVFCAVAPRMRGPFGFSVGKGVQVGGEFGEPETEATKRGPAPRPEPPNRGPDAG